ncbi:hypothetical protein [Streptosporangium sp. NPDC087985]|uniref:hypothetical protein n=1 Tax=Streptosporangium sp. NPDC087985 TaxID=3366196 RepID=UPI00382BFFC6
MFSESEAEVYLTAGFRARDEPVKDERTQHQTGHHRERFVDGRRDGPLPDPADPVPIGFGQVDDPERADVGAVDQLGGDDEVRSPPGLLAHGGHGAGCAVGISRPAARSCSATSSPVLTMRRNQVAADAGRLCTAPDR